MNVYVVLIRGINVGGKNRIPMSDLKKYLEDLGFLNVSTYIASGNVFLKSDQQPSEIQAKIEKMLPRRFVLDAELIRVLVLSYEQLKAIIENKPDGFGDHPEEYHSDVIFLMGVDSASALSVLDPRDGVDAIWPGRGVIYSQRLSALRTKSRLSKIVGTATYKSMTIRNWATTTKLLSALDAMKRERHHRI